MTRTHGSNPFPNRTVAQHYPRTRLDVRGVGASLRHHGVMIPSTCRWSRWWTLSPPSGVVRVEVTPPSGTSYPLPIMSLWDTEQGYLQPPPREGGVSGLGYSSGLIPVLPQHGMSSLPLRYWQVTEWNQVGLRYLQLPVWLWLGLSPVKLSVWVWLGLFLYMLIQSPDNQTSPEINGSRCHKTKQISHFPTWSTAVCVP